MGYWSRFLSSMWGRTPKFPMTFAYPTVLKNGELYSGRLVAWPVGGTRVGYTITNGKPQYGILKFIAKNSTEDGVPLYTQVGDGDPVEVKGLMFISGSTTWRDEVNI